jgi:hypothetical protein
MAEEACIGCGATSAGVFVCHNCGVPCRPLVDAQSQRQALDELHGQLGSEGAPAGLLKNAFIPDDPRVLIEAGLRMLPALEDAAGQSDAAGRMRAIIIKLRLVGDDPSLARAGKEFEEALESYRKSDRRMGWTLAIIAAVLLAVAVSQCT